ncbi:MAG: hypothetical protein K2N35_04450 [Muribaculaceae bacterium]|nr:hypothetical protein [Muribaculaceae bacterium]
MEKDEIIYDLEDKNISENAELPGTSENSESAAVSENAEDSSNSDDSEDAEGIERPADPDNSEESGKQEPNSAEAEIQKMLADVGAETLLQIIKDNRNAAIRQIISEVEASRDRSIPSGASSASPCKSIFDLAALA